MKKLFVLLNGGLGNQMFQYATARVLAEKNNAELILDTWSGFANDTEYKRVYELGPFPINARPATLMERIPFWVYRVFKKINKGIDNNDAKKFFGRFLNENKLQYLPEIASAKLTSSQWLIGYWQSPLYFEGYKEVLLKELMPPSPTSQKFLEMGKQIMNTESVAVGIRLYEESSDPGAHALNGIVKTVNDVNIAIDKMLSEKPCAKFYIFCTHRSPFLSKLNLPASTVYLTHDDEYEGTLERLWLLTRCKHHIFTNSSYYWWAAWLSQQVHPKDSQIIFAADNFINRDGLYREWRRF